MIIHDNSIKKIVEHRKNELSENIDTYVLKLYPNIGTYTIFEFHYVHTDNISVYIYIYREREREGERNILRSAYTPFKAGKNSCALTKYELQSARYHFHIFIDFFEIQKSKINHLDQKNKKYEKYLRCDLSPTCDKIILL